MSRRAAPKAIPERAARRFPMSMVHIAPHADTLAYRAALGHFATGVRSSPRCAATARRSADRQLVQFGVTGAAAGAVSLATRSPSLDAFSSAAHYAINVLRPTSRCCRSASQTPLPDKFAGVALQPGPSGVPLIRRRDDAADLRAPPAHCGGDHVIFIGHVLGYHVRAIDPLIYCRGRYLAESQVLRGRIRRRRSAERRGHRPRLVGPHDHGPARRQTPSCASCVWPMSTRAPARRLQRQGPGVLAQPRPVLADPQVQGVVLCTRTRSTASRSSRWHRRAATCSAKSLCAFARRGAARDRRGEPASRRTRCRPRAALRAADHRGAGAWWQRRARRAAAGGR